MKLFELGQYKGLNVERFDISVKEDEVNEAIDHILKTLEEIRIEKNDDPIETGDYVVVNVEGVENGMPVPKLIENNLQFRVGDDNVLSDLSMNLLGKNMGDTVIFDTCIQPVSLEFQALWGCYIHFTVEILAVFMIKKPELTERIIQEIEPNVKTLQEFKKTLEDQIWQEKRSRAHVANINEVIGTLAGQCKYEFDQEILNQAAEELYRNFSWELKKHHNTELIVYLIQRKISADELLTECKEEAARKILREKILDAVIQAEGIKVTAEEINYLKEKWIGKHKNEQAVDLVVDAVVLETQCLRNKAMNFLLDVNLVR
ncbi:trigger factor [Dehalobacter sp. 14DCB1]|uniref:trigger factor n=1 Tax=Dehalobacter sp. 14DCB1 TaxID=2070227 RepID=UPI0010524AE1|nr:trigger factor [Dehalobacter sp. 14DCB1]TCX51687.1 trigger factor [Dehalobacter sp. 14DCB1]